MPNRDQELKRLAQADRRIAEAHERIAYMTWLVEGRTNGVGAVQGRRVLGNMQSALGTMLQHRRMIEGVIAALDSGTLPSTELEDLPPMGRAIADRVLRQCQNRARLKVLPQGRFEVTVVAK